MRTPRLCLLSFLLSSLVLHKPTFAIKKSYMVFGAPSHPPNFSELELTQVREHHCEFLGSLLGSHEVAKNSIFYSYTRHINGFAATLEEEDAAQIAKHPKVISVFLNKGRKLHTTRSWDFLGLEHNGVTPPNSIWEKARYGEDTIIANLDTGLTSSIILRNGRLSDLLAQLQELCKGVNESEILPEKYDSSILRAQIQQLSEEIRELILSGPVTIYNGNSDSGGSYASYLIPAAALGAMGYCYMKWKGWSFSDVMYATRHNMANAFATVSKEIETLHETLAITRSDLTKQLEELDWKVEEERERMQLTANDVNEVKRKVSQMGFDVEAIRQLVSGMDGKVDLLESKQDVTNSGIWYLCQVAEGSKDRLETIIQDVSAKLTKHLTMTSEDKSLKGLQFIAETKKLSMVEKSMTSTKTTNPSNFPGQKVPALKTRIHRAYPVGISLHRDITSSDS